MEVSIDRSGRIVLPKELLDRLGLRPRSKLVIEEVSGGIHLHPLELQNQLERTEHGVLVLRGGLERPIEDLVTWSREQRLSEILSGS